MRIDQITMPYNNSGGLWIPKTLISQAVAAGDATIDFTLPEGFKFFEVTIQYYLPGTDNTNLYLRTSPDGSTFDSAASDYAYVNHTMNTSAQTTVSSTADSQIRIDRNITTNQGIGNAGGETFNSRILIYNAGSSANYTIVDALSGYQDSAALVTRTSTAGARLSASATLAIRFLSSSGTLGEGNFNLFGFN